MFLSGGVTHAGDSPDFFLGRIGRFALILLFVLELTGCAPAQSGTQSSPEDLALLEAMSTWNQDGAKELIANGANPNMEVAVHVDGAVHHISLLHHVIVTPASIHRENAVGILMGGGADPYALHWKSGRTPLEVALDLYLLYYHQSRLHPALEYRDVVFTLLRYHIKPELMSDRGLLMLTAPIDAYDLPMIYKAVDLDYGPDVIKFVIERVRTKKYDDERPRDKDLLLKVLNDRLRELEDGDA